MTIQKRIQVGATSTNANILAGAVFEFCPSDLILNFGFVIEAAGLLVTILRNGEIIAEDLVPNIGAAATTMPKVPDDYMVTDEPFLQGDRITVKVQNTTAGALYINYALNYTQV